MTVREVYDGSDGDATKALYAQLATYGPIGEVALNLFRANKNSARAKQYRGGLRGRGSYKSMAYGRKEWALSNLCAVLTQHADALRMPWGWQRDDATPGYAWVLYVVTPHGQVSFHAPSRGQGPDFPGQWDGVREVSADRIIAWCEDLLAQEAVIRADVDAQATFCPRCCVWWPAQRNCPKCSARLIEKTKPAPPDYVRPGVVAEWS